MGHEHGFSPTIENEPPRSELLAHLKAVVARREDGGCPRLGLDMPRRALDEKWLRAQQQQQEEEQGRGGGKKKKKNQQPKKKWEFQNARKEAPAKAMPATPEKKKKKQQQQQQQQSGGSSSKRSRALLSAPGDGGHDEEAVVAAALSAAKRLRGGGDKHEQQISMGDRVWVHDWGKGYIYEVESEPKPSSKYVLLKIVENSVDDEEDDARAPLSSLRRL